MSEPAFYYIRLNDMHKTPTQATACYPMVHYYEYSDMKQKCEDLQAELESSLRKLEKAQSTQQWKPIESIPTGRFIGYHKTKQGFEIVGEIISIPNEIVFACGIANRPTHWQEFPATPEQSNL
jgi:hypothetical protein